MHAERDVLHAIRLVPGAGRQISFSVATVQITGRRANIIRGLISRGYEDAAIARIAGHDALDLLRRTIG